MQEESKTTLEEKITKAKTALAALVGATQDPEVRAAICDGFWENDDPEVFSENAELAARNYAEDEPIEVRCSVSLPNFFVSWKNRADSNEIDYVYEQ